MFNNRKEAGQMLATALSQYERGSDAIVLGVPRGGVPISFEIASALFIPMDIILVKKIGHPDQPELAIGAVDVEGHYTWDRTMGVSEEWVRREADKIRERLQERNKKFRGGSAPPKLKGKTVIITDDGVATGKTLLATIELVYKKDPAKVVIAVPVAPPQTITRLKEAVDEVVCLETPSPFYAIGQFYRDFEQESDEHVIELIRRSAGIGGSGNR